MGGARATTAPGADDQVDDASSYSVERPRALSFLRRPRWLRALHDGDMPVVVGPFCN
jgi:hypothetical protein